MHQISCHCTALVACSTKDHLKFAPLVHHCFTGRASPVPLYLAISIPHLPKLEALKHLGPDHNIYWKVNTGLWRCLDTPYLLTMLRRQWVWVAIVWCHSCCIDSLLVIILCVDNVDECSCSESGECYVELVMTDSWRQSDWTESDQCRSVELRRVFFSYHPSPSSEHCLLQSLQKYRQWVIETLLFTARQHD